MTESRTLVLTKALLAALAVAAFVEPLATPAGLAAGISAAFVGHLLGRGAAKSEMRLGAGLGLAAAIALLGAGLAQLLGAHLFGLSVTRALEVADALLFGSAAGALCFALRFLSSRVRLFALFELALVVASVVHLFRNHRHHHLDQPHLVSDWSWSHGIDPATLLVLAGVLVVLVAAVALLETRRPGKFVVTVLLLGLVLLAVPGTVRMHQGAADTNGLGLTRAPADQDGRRGRDGTKRQGGDKGGDKADNKGRGSSNGGGGGNGDDDGSSGGRRPNPVAIVLLHDELPEDLEVLYLRQSVLSRLAENRLVEDNSGRFDRDVVGRLSPPTPSPQVPAFHRRLHTSTFLIVDHAHWFGLGQPIAMRPIDNPDPRRFVAAYDVDSYLARLPPERLIGHEALPPDWTAEKRAHYLAVPHDPRYRALGNRIVRDLVDPRFVGDDVVTALAIRHYLEQHGVYSARKRRLVGDDPTGQFLFGDMHGYCVHFAHAAVLLLRTQGIPARVALGYAVQTRQHGAGGAVLVLDSQAHAWPEIFVRGVGWVTFDIHPERSEEPPPQLVDVDLESLWGELARKEQDTPKAKQTDAVLPWRPLVAALGLLGLGLLAVAYLVKIVRRLRAGTPRTIYRGVLDRLSDVGAARRPGESREQHAARLAALAPSFVSLTQLHLRATLGRGAGPDTLASSAALARAVGRELGHNLKTSLRLAGWLNPIGWWFTR